MNLFETISGLSIVGGAAVGAVVGFREFGVLGAVVGVPLGAALGWVVVFALPLLGIVGVAALVVWVRCGRAEARRFLWGRGDGPTTDAHSPGR